MRYICPVCGYNNLSGPPANWLICPSCLTEFGYNDVGQTYEELRADWIASGAKWESSLPRPPRWDPERQLRNIDVHLTNEERAAIRVARETSIGQMRIVHPAPVRVGLERAVTYTNKPVAAVIDAVIALTGDYRVFA